jgi:hypothetical protein
MNRMLRCFLFAVVTCALLACSGWGQTKPKAGTIEMTLYGGGTFDLPGAASYAGLFDNSNSTNSVLKYEAGRKINPLVGGSLALSLAKILWAYGDYSYVVPDRTSANVALFNSTGVTTTNRHYWDANGGFQLMFPTVQRVVPYLEVGLGILHQNYDTSSAYTNIVISSNPTRTGNTSRTHPVVNSILTPHVGGGVRIFVKERSGFKFSVDGYYGGTGIEEQVPGAASSSFPTITRRGWGRLTAGYFFRFGRH